MRSKKRYISEKKQGKQLHRSRWIYRMNQAKKGRFRKGSGCRLHETICHRGSLFHEKQTRQDRQRSFKTCLLFTLRFTWARYQTTFFAWVLQAFSSSHRITTRALHFMTIPNQAQTRKSAACSRRQTNIQAKEERKAEETPKQKRKKQRKPYYAK